MREVTITVERRNGRPLFRFEAADGRVAAMMIAVTKEGAEAPLWWVVPESFVAEYPFTVVPEEGEDGQPERDGQVQRSFTHEELQERVASDPENRAVAEVIYGQVPAGFRQAVPRHGQAPDLEPGANYWVSVVGACYGQASFQG